MERKRVWYAKYIGYCFTDMNDQHNPHSSPVGRRLDRQKI